ncbi:mediator of RNA polymerase II transcription subunit 15A-like, partial [Trifolium medium]|nr:mediator of RNA polymerase II transcription subunit 15A-like [Trifolium medium]
KKAVGNYHEEEDLPELEGDSGVLIEPEAVLAKRIVQIQGEKVNQVLIHWKGQVMEEATWEDTIVIKSKFPNFCLEDKAMLNGGGIVRTPIQEVDPNESLIHHNIVGPKVWKVYSRRFKQAAKS